MFALLYGPAYHEVGTWDATGTNFTPTGGMWETSYRGTMGADGSLQLHIVGTGWGGTIDGLRVEETLTRAAGAILDPALPYHYAGTMKPPPLSTSEMLDDFNDNEVTAWLPYVSDRGSGGATEANQQFTVWGSFPGVVTHSFFDSYSFKVLNRSPWSVGEGQTLEARVDLIGFNNEGTSAFFELGTTSGLYGLLQGRAFIAILKYSPANGFSVSACETVQVRQTDVILSLALTRVSPNLIVTARVFDKTKADVLLYERNVVDSPQADPSLTVNEYEALSGMRMSADFNPDTAGVPFIFFRPGIGLIQYNDGTKQQAEATFDNLELRTHEVPPLGIGQAVVLSWPDVGSYSIESAPGVQGPWLPLRDTVPRGMKQITVPLSGPAQFFRLRQAP